MTQAFYTAIGGMAAGQTKISVVADNIANMNTIGFKASNVNFSDVLLQNIIHRSGTYRPDGWY